MPLDLHHFSSLSLFLSCTPTFTPKASPGSPLGVYAAVRGARNLQNEATHEGNECLCFFAK
eukprot:5682598-Prorocentrum_lima.AAC.1